MNEGCDKLRRNEWHDIGMDRTIQRLAVRVAVGMTQGHLHCGSIVAVGHILMIASISRSYHLSHV